ncbi:MAG: integrase arm-type DNA-binding domain-containing protein [Paracoccaceae bacterium]|nr:integrase arm-type DNA-binding domain-containing protein [Paracoccaceae bacterium]
MPKIAKELGPLDVKRLTHPGKGGNALFAVGGVNGLHLQITPTEARSWVLRVQIGTKRRDVGLGSYPTTTLAQARDRAREAREAISKGIDPVEERKAHRAALEAAQHQRMTFKDAVERYLPAKVEVGAMTKHKAQWRSTLTTYALPVLGNTPVADIAMKDVLRVLEPIWEGKNETASRLRQRIEAVLSWATVAGHRTGDNPARWKGNLAEMLPKPSAVKDEAHQPAVSIADAPRWWAHLSRMEGQGACALRFAALCGSRSGEIRELTWGEVQFENVQAGAHSVANRQPVTLVIPAAKMKAKRDHVVPLSDAAVLVLREGAGLAAGEEWPVFPRDALVFPAPRGGALSDMSVSAVMRRMHEAEVKAGRVGYLDGMTGRPAVPHGCRSTFRDWAGKSGFPRELAEEALAHAIKNKAEAAYAREHMAERRKPMMQAWAHFLTYGEALSGNVIGIRGNAV